MDLIRMLLEGAAIVRFANTFLNAFRQAKNFVLCAIFIWNNGAATRYTLFQRQNGHEVCCVLYISKLAGSDVVGLLQSKGTFVE